MTKDNIEKGKNTALEFMMTYGWAILIVLIAIGALFYFGVLNPLQNTEERVDCYYEVGNEYESINFHEGIDVIECLDRFQRRIEFDKERLLNGSFTAALVIEKYRK